MTLPYERANALRYTIRFLQSLMDRQATPRVPMVIRQQARSLLKHFPHEWEIEQAQKKQPELWGPPKPEKKSDA